MAKAAPTYQKLRGGYYTPKPIADFLARWAIQSSKAEVLEPSCGDGILLGTALETLRTKGAKTSQAILQMHGVEIDREEAHKAIRRLESLTGYVGPGTIQIGDFFVYCKAHLNNKRKFDAVIGNPPFIRYQNFLEEQRIPAFELMARAGLRPSRVTNTSVPVLVASSFLLNQTGRLAMVIPAELLQVNYAAELRQFLSNYYKKLTIITFKKLIFEGIQQEVVLLLGERNGDPRTGIRTVELNSIEDLSAYEHQDFLKRELKPLDHTKDKWTKYFLSKREIELLKTLECHPKVVCTGHYFEVDVGIVTGQNSFFVLTMQQTEDLGLENYTKRIVSRSAHLKGVVFSESDWEQNVRNNFPALLLDLPKVPFSKLPNAAKRYVEAGEGAKLNTSFKCRIRDPWYIVPSVWVPDAFLLRQIHAYPKLIVNKAKATSTDTIHRVRMRNTGAKTIAASFLNSLTFAFAEVIGRSYGGGVLELEPNEAERLPLPLTDSNLDLKNIHSYLLKDDINSALNLTDEILLIKGLGLTKRDVNNIRSIWTKLRDRRINRKHNRKEKPPHKRS